MVSKGVTGCARAEKKPSVTRAKPVAQGEEERRRDKPPCFCTGRKDAALAGDEMRDYQPKKNPYYLEHTLYRRVLALVRDYPRMVRAREEIIYESPEGTGGGRGEIGRPTETKALRLATLADDIRAVERALEKLPREYRQGVLENVANGRRMDDLPGARSTWSRWRGRFLWYVAKNQRWV